MKTFPQILDFNKLRKSTFPTWITLIAGSWLGLAWTSAASFGFATPVALPGVLAVPLWGTLWGLVGIGRARDAGIRANGVTVLEPDHPLSQVTHHLCDRLGMQTRPWVGTMAAANAYAIGSGPSKSIVVIGMPLVEKLEPLELAAIIGHELGHVANNDMRRMAFARSFQNALTWFAGAQKLKDIAKWVLTWGSELAILKLSRKREYWADAVGAALTSPDAMVRALEKIHGFDHDLDGYERQYARIMFRGFAGTSWLSTHPTLQERVDAVRDAVYLRGLPLLRRDGFLSPTRESAASTSPVPVRPAASDLAY